MVVYLLYSRITIFLFPECSLVPNRAQTFGSYLNLVCELEFKLDWKLPREEEFKMNFDCAKETVFVEKSVFQYQTRLC